jgi:hypothetical protein
MAAARAAGVRLGRPRRCPDEVLVRVVAAKVGGATYYEIADKLNADCVPTPGGRSRWYPSYVYDLLNTRDGLMLLDLGTSDRAALEAALRAG